MAKGTVVIDPGHGGNVEVGGSSANNATSPSGVMEKNLALRMGLLVREALEEAAKLGGHTIKIHMTRETDKNLGLAARAAFAKAKNANVFLCIHFNASVKHNARGVETLISPKAKNANHAADKAFAQRVQTAVLNAIKRHDPGVKDRKVKDQPLTVLNDRNLGTKIRGCLCEVEFLDTKAVDNLFNLGANATQVRKDVAQAMANAIIEDLKAHP
jgi:N-acetylmuramoyl-L-alanine amidase